MSDLEQAKQLFMAGLAAEQRGDWSAAEIAYRDALALAPGRASVLNNLAGALIRQRRFEDAAEYCRQALAAEPGLSAAQVNLGTCQSELGEDRAALATFQDVLKVDPAHSEAQKNCAAILVKLNCHVEALEMLDAFPEAPDDPELLCNRGIALKGLNRDDEASACLNRAIELQPEHAEALAVRGGLHERQGNHAAALADFKKSRLLKPHQPQIDAAILSGRGWICDWDGLEIEVAKLSADIRSRSKLVGPWHFFKESEDPVLQLQCAENFANSKVSVPETIAARPHNFSHQKIRVAYISPDFGRHPTAHLFAGVLDKHDRSRFELTGVCLYTRPDGEMRQRLRQGFGEFIEAQNISTSELISTLAERGIDIAVDMAGFTAKNRMELFAHRAAPVQVNYLGFPGTVGTSFHDYIIADHHQVPSGWESYYSEKIVRLPDAYLPTDGDVVTPADAPTRAELGLPEDGFVFCCLSKPLKMKPTMFSIWMRLLHRIEGSVLWLLSDQETVHANLRREAEARGISGDRIIFSGRRPYEEYLSLFRRADLFIDTFPNSAHTVTCDALRGGLPLVTCSGRGFASRVAGSLLKANGLPELVTESLEDFEALALELASDRTKLAGIAAKIDANRPTYPLFDTPRYTRHLETAYEMMVARARQGLPPADLDVPTHGVQAAEPLGDQFSSVA